MSSFHDVRLPLSPALGANGGPERLTDVVQLASGLESRNARWQRSRRRWDIGGAVLRADAAHELLAFFEARRGRMHGFRFRDPLDWKSCLPSGEISFLDQVIGTGDGETAAFQLVKRYESGGAWVERVVSKPVEASVVVAVNGVETSSFVVDWDAGIVTFEDAPAEGAVVTAGFAFDVPVRFDADRLELSLVGHDVVRVLRAPLVELLG
ncbi:MAG: TIGR02217 family protein [Alphaproteobacteria bacterium]|nr:MAG: TIGR02217 family protein [Alphaproteobacteria bacterium]